MGEYLELHDVGPVEHIRLEWADRLNILTGDNAAGRTLVLDCLWWALTRTWAGRRILPDSARNADPRISFLVGGKTGSRSPVDARFHYPSRRWRRPRGRPVMPGLVIYLRANSSFAVWDPARNYWRRPTGDVEQEGDAEQEGDVEQEGDELAVTEGKRRAYQFSADEVWNGLRENGQVFCAGLVDDWVNWQYGKKALFEVLTSVLGILSPPGAEKLIPSEPLRVDPDDARDIPSIRLPYGDVPVTHLSAGMRRIVALAYLMVWAVHENRQAAAARKLDSAQRLIVLIDEVEAHLHPSWQRAILPAALTAAGVLARGVEFQLVASTHAPMVMASVEPLFDPGKDKRFEFAIREGSIQGSEKPFRSRGDASAWLTSEVFGLAQARSLEAEAAIGRAEEALRNPELSLDDLRAVHHELHELLGDLDPFWPRWVAYAEKQGLEP